MTLMIYINTSKKTFNYLFTAHQMLPVCFHISNPQGCESWGLAEDVKLREISLLTSFNWNNTELAFATHLSQSRLQFAYKYARMSHNAQRKSYDTRTIFARNWEFGHLRLSQDDSHYCVRPVTL